MEHFHHLQQSRATAALMILKLLADTPSFWLLVFASTCVLVSTIGFVWFAIRVARPRLSKRLREIRERE